MPTPRGHRHDGTVADGAVTLIENEDDVARFEPGRPLLPLGFVTQTTLSVDDTAGIIRASALEEKFC